MGNPVVHFEVIGKHPQKLRDYYQELFEWKFDVGGPVAAGVSEAGKYGFTEGNVTKDGAGIPGGIGGGESFDGHVIFYVGVPDVEKALSKAESLGGKRVMGPDKSPGTSLVVGHFVDLEGNLVGLAEIG